MPASMPATETGGGAARRRRASPGTSWTITRTIAPTPTPNSSAARLGLKAEAPIQAPRIAGAPAIRPRPSRRPQPQPAAGPPPRSGATIARPSVVLWIAKPTTRKAPSASAPVA